MDISLLQRRVIRYTPIVFLIFSYLAVGVDSIVYPGFFGKHFFIDSRILTALSLILLYGIFASRKWRMPSRLISLNALVLFPFSIISVGILTLLEYIKYPNFVFATLHIHYDQLFYILILSAFTYVAFLDKKTIRKHRQVLLVWFAVFLLYAGILVRMWPQDAFLIFSGEDDLFEWLQFFFYLLSSVSSFYLMIQSYKKKKYFSVFVYGMLGLFAFFVAGEEISWGQRLFHIPSPSFLLKNNYQREISVHNLNSLQQFQYLFYMAFSLFFLVGRVTTRFISKKLSKIIQRFISPWYLFLYFLPIFVFYLYMNFLGGTHREWQEFSELLLAIGILLYVWETRRKQEKTSLSK